MMNRRSFIAALVSLPIVGKLFAQKAALVPTTVSPIQAATGACYGEFTPTYFPKDVWLVITPDMTVQVTRGPFKGEEKLYTGRTDRFATEEEAQEFVKGLWIEEVVLYEAHQGRKHIDQKYTGWLVSHVDRKIGTFGWAFETKEEAEAHRNTITIQRG